MERDAAPLTHAQSIELPGGALFQHSVLIVSYFDADGDTRYAFGVRGESTVSAAVGLLEIIKFHMLRSVDLGEDD